MPARPALSDGVPTYPGSTGAGSATGITQTGDASDFGIPYGLRTRYVVQVDAVQRRDRIDITSGPTAFGQFGAIFQPDTMAVFFRSDGGVSLYDGGVVETPVTAANGAFDLDTGLRSAGRWHNYGVLFDRGAKTVEIFLDEQSKGVIDLTTFGAGADRGIYQNFSNEAVGIGGGVAQPDGVFPQEDRIWTDNFQVGAVPEPGALGLGAVCLLSLRRDRLWCRKDPRRPFFRLRF